jgi:phosphoribosylaminoimidazole-succinocarboxamide synthase
MANGFQGKEGQTVPVMDDDFVNLVSERYIELYENITGNTFERADVSNVPARVENNIKKFLEAYYR